MKKVAVAAFALLAIFLASVLMPCVLTAPDSDSPSPVLDRTLSVEVENEFEVGEGGVTGNVKMRDSPVTEYTLKFVDIDTPQGEVKSSEFNIKADDGAYAVTLTQGRYNVSVTTPKASEVVTSTTPVEVKEGEWTEGVNFKFESSYSFHGNVSYGDAYLSGVNVSLTPVGSTSKTVTQTDEYGHYQFEDLRGGAYEILFQKSGFADERQIVNITVQPYLIISMERTGLPGINGFILEYDFQHSMMVIGLVGMIVMIVISLCVRYYLTRNPNMILNDDTEERIED